jgi:hypothetical protein
LRLMRSHGCFFVRLGGPFLRPHIGLGLSAMICPLDRWITQWGNAATICLNGPDPGILQSAESLCSPEVPEITSHFSVGVVSVNTLLQLVQAVDRTREQRKHR